MTAHDRSFRRFSHSGPCAVIDRAYNQIPAMVPVLSPKDFCSITTLPRMDMCRLANGVGPGNSMCLPPPPPTRIVGSGCPLCLSLLDMFEPYRNIELSSSVP